MIIIQIKLSVIGTQQGYINHISLAKYTDKLCPTEYILYLLEIKRELDQFLVSLNQVPPASRK
jgi:hypothetical protein